VFVGDRVGGEPEGENGEGKEDEEQEENVFHGAITDLSDERDLRMWKLCGVNEMYVDGIRSQLMVGRFFPCAGLAAGVMLGMAGAGFGQVVTSTAAAATTRPSQAAVLAANTVTHLDVGYGGPDKGLDVLDIYGPAKVKGAAVLLFVHGGEWSRGDKGEVSTKPKFFNENGVVFVSMNYRLSPKDKHPAQADDVATAIGWLHAHIGEYGGDGNKIVIMGHSAGTHLVTLVGLDGEYLAKAGLKPSVLKGVVAWSGGQYDLLDQVKSGGSYEPYIKATFGEDAAEEKAASPMTYAGNAKGGPAFLIAAVDDARGQASRDASKAMVEAIKAAGGNVRSETLVGKSHFTSNHEIGAAGDKTGPMLLAFIQSVTQ
jgi:arylformamidase